MIIRVNLPSEALPATVLELDETDKISNSHQRKLISKTYDSDTYVDMEVVLRKKKNSKESLSPLAKSEDIVDEELAHMAQAESLDILSINVCTNVSLKQIPILYSLLYSTSLLILLF